MEYRLVKELWACDDNRIAVRFAYECHDAQGQWWRAYGNENWQFENDGLMAVRHACINDLAITEGQRLFHWTAAGPDRPAIPASPISGYDGTTNGGARIRRLAVIPLRLCAAAADRSDPANTAAGARARLGQRPGAPPRVP